MTRRFPRFPEHRNLARPLQSVLQADSIDEFASSCRVLLKAAMPFHSLCVSFSRLEYVCPWLIRDTLPIRCDFDYVNERYHVLNPTQPFLRQNVGVPQSNFAEQVGLMPTSARDSYLRRFKEREGWDKYAEIHFWDQRTLQASICVRRGANQPDFSPENLRFLAEVREIFAVSVNRLHRQHRDRATVNCFQQVLAKLPLPLLILNWDLEPDSLNQQARRACADWVLGSATARTLKLGRFAQIPAEVLAACEKAKATLVRTGFAAGRWQDTHPRFQTIVHPTDPRLTAQIEVMNVSRELIDLPRFLIRFQAVPNPRHGVRVRPEVSASHPLAALACLTPCEREVARLVAEGLSNQAVAVRLSRELATVKMHLRSVFKKLRVENRTCIAILLAGDSAPR